MNAHNQINVLIRYKLIGKDSIQSIIVEMPPCKDWEQQAFDVLIKSFPSSKVNAIILEECTRLNNLKIIKKEGC